MKISYSIVTIIFACVFMVAYSQNCTETYCKCTAAGGFEATCPAWVNTYYGSTDENNGCCTDGEEDIEATADGNTVINNINSDLGGIACVEVCPESKPESFPDTYPSETSLSPAAIVSIAKPLAIAVIAGSSFLA